MLVSENPPRNGEGDHAQHGGGGPALDVASAERRAPSVTPSARHLPVPGRNEERGFTLVELMVVIVIIGLLATIVIINVLPSLQVANSKKVQADIAVLEEGLNMYRLQNQRYPTTQEGLQVLVPNPVQRLPNDPWNHPYLYATPGPNGAPYRIASLGADGKEGGSGEDADITN